MIQANEVERLVTWYNPLGRSDLLIPGEDDITTWRTHGVSEKQYREIARIAWDICPELAVFLPDRLTCSCLIAALCSCTQAGMIRLWVAGKTV